MEQQQFDGKTFDQARDGARLSRQLAAVQLFTADRCWHTLNEISRACEASEASVSARLRDLRKKRFGSYMVSRRHVGGGLYQYRVWLPIVKPERYHQPDLF